MEYLEIEGGRPLCGQVCIQGSKNAVLPMISAALLYPGKTILHNCPKIRDVEVMLEILQHLGCRHGWDGTTLWIDTKDVHSFSVPKQLASLMRSSITLLGSMLGRMGQAQIPCPGGCVIGARPIDLHIEGLRKLGVTFQKQEERVDAYCERLKGACIRLLYPSVGATENILLASVLAEGITCIQGAAREPEILELCALLKKMGACIGGEGSSVLWIRGVKQLHEAEHTVVSDRIVVGTYLSAVAACGGEILLKRVPVSQMGSTLEVFRNMGVCIHQEQNSLFIKAEKDSKRPVQIQTMPYPGFPTDLQSPLLAVLSLTPGRSSLTETVFEDRFKVVEDLSAMGANIHVIGNTAYVDGVKNLQGNTLEARELRGGAALCVAAAAAEGTSRIYGCQYIFRGYENMIRDLTMLGIVVHLEKSN